MIQFIVKFLVWMVFVSMTSSEIHQGGGAIELTSRTFDKSVRDGSVWLIELYGKAGTVRCKWVGIHYLDKCDDSF